MLVAVAQLGEVLASVAGVNPSFMGTPEKAAALAELSRIESQVAELRLRIEADAADVAEGFAGRDVAGWMQWATRCRGEDARADLRLAVALDRRYATLGAALREGSANLAQARVVAKTLDELPAEIPTEVMARAEEALVGHCAEFGPRQLAQIGRRIVEVVAPQIADAAEARALARLEQQAHRATRLSFHRVGDGTTRITGLLPDLAATRLVTYLEAFTNPRRQGSGPDRRPYPRRLGKAFVRFLEAADPARLPIHGGDATTVVITIDHHALTEELATAGVIGAEEKITAAQARRLACNAHLIPAVLGPERSGSQVLDLGRIHQALQPGPTQSTPGPRPRVPSRRLRHPRHLDRSPPLDPLVPRRQVRPDQRHPAVLPPPPPRPRPHLRSRPAPQRRRPIHPQEVTVRSSHAAGRYTDGTWRACHAGDPTSFGSGVVMFFVLALLGALAFTIWKVSTARRMARDSGMDVGDATAMTLLSDDGFESTYLASNLRDHRPQQPTPVDKGTTADRLAELQGLHERGLVTEEEYATARGRILEGL